MSVLGKLTDEYFGKTLRDESGKFINVLGCKVTVPGNYDEEMFLDTVKDFMEILSSSTNQSISFTEEEYFQEDTDGEILQMKCSNDIYMEIDITYGYLLELWENEFPKREMNETLYKSIVTFLRFISKDVEIVFHDGVSHIMLSPIDEFYEKFVEFFEDNDYNDEKENCINELVNMFFNEFENDAHIIRNELEFYLGENYGEFVAMKIFNGSDVFQFNTFLYAKRMRQWWREIINRIEEEGVVEFFKLDE